MKVEQIDWALHWSFSLFFFLKGGCCWFSPNISDRNSCISLLKIHIFLLFISSKIESLRSLMGRQKASSMKGACTFERFEPSVKAAECSEVYGISIFKSFICTHGPSKLARSEEPRQAFAFSEITLPFWYWVCSIFKPEREILSSNSLKGAKILQL